MKPPLSAAILFLILCLVSFTGCIPRRRLSSAERGRTIQEAMRSQ